MVGNVDRLNKLTFSTVDLEKKVTCRLKKKLFKVKLKNEVNLSCRILLKVTLLSRLSILVDRHTLPNGLKPISIVLSHTVTRPLFHINTPENEQKVNSKHLKYII